MPEIVTGFRPPEKPNNLLINKDHSGIPPAILPTKIREEPKLVDRPRGLLMNPPIFERLEKA
jgi:hypothetical protein